MMSLFEFARGPHSYDVAGSYKKERIEELNLLGRSAIIVQQNITRLAICILIRWL